MNTRISLLAGFVLVSTIIYGCGKKDDSPAVQAVVPQTCPAGTVPSTGNQYAQYPNQQYPGYQQYPGQYPNQQYPGQYPNQQYPGYAQQACVPVGTLPGPGGSGTGGTIPLPPPAGGTLGSIPAGVSLAGYITVTDRQQFNKFLKENSGQCGTGALYAGRSECNNYTTGGYMEVNGNGTSATGGVAAGPYTGIGTDGGYLAVTANFQHYVISGGTSFELRAQGAAATQGYASILAIRGTSALVAGQAVQVVLSYKSMTNSNFVEFGRATLQPK